MNNYMAYLSQGGGCDYTIGCGLKLVYLKSDNHKDAVEELANIIRGHVGENALGSATLFQVSGQWAMNVQKIYDEAEEASLKNQTEEEKKRELQQLEYLKKKYENITKEVVRDAMSAVSKDVRLPKAVRDGIIPPPPAPPKDRKLKEGRIPKKPKSQLF